MKWQTTSTHPTQDEAIAETLREAQEIDEPMRIRIHEARCTQYGDDARPCTCTPTEITTGGKA